MPARTRKRATARESEVVRKALAHGRGLAGEVIRAREKKKRTTLEAKGPSRGLLIAEGDSWFDYPFFDVLERLEDGFGYVVESVAHKGDTVESIAYDASQVSKLARLFEKLGGQGAQPRAILLSGGGNDIAGDEFPIMLNHQASGLSVLNDSIVNGVIDERLKFAVVSVISSVTTLSKRYFGRTVPVLIHGYAHAIPDGRGYLGGAWILPGPWLKPGFTQKGYGDLKFNAGVVAALIDRFNAMMQGIPAAPELAHVKYLDLRNTISSDLSDYKKSWNDELHPTKPGFGAIAGVFAAVIEAFPKVPGAGPKGVRPRATTRRAVRRTHK